MKRFVGICVILGILGASLEGAADIAGSGDPCCDDALCVYGDPISHSDERRGDADTEHGCIACTPFCHCGSPHGSALVVDWSHGTCPTPSFTPTHIAPRYVSFVDPPSLPPPIL